MMAWITAMDIDALTQRVSGLVMLLVLVLVLVLILVLVMRWRSIKRPKT